MGFMMVTNFKRILGKKPNGYWNEKITISELESIIKELKHFPSRTELVEINRADLINGIRKNGGFNCLREKMGYDFTRKSRDYWNDESIVSELKPIIEELGHFPLHAEIIKMKRTDLLGAMISYGGMKLFREKLGFETLKKPKGYWTDKTIMSELEPIIDELDHFPSLLELKKMNKHKLLNAIYTHGNVKYFREKLGQEPFKKNYIPGVCTIIKKHHDDLIDDPERLSTDFIQKIIGSNCDIDETGNV